MDVQTIKLELIQALINTNEIKVLEKVRNLLFGKKYELDDDNEIVGNRPGGEPITRAELLREIEISMKQAKNEEVTSHEDLVRQSENW
jgi:hypothetical protein